MSGSLTVVAFADELLDGVVEGFATAYAEEQATLVVVGYGPSQAALDCDLEAAAAAAGLPAGALDVVGVVASAGDGIEEELAALADLVLTRRPVPAAFRFVMRAEPPTAGPLAPGPVGPLAPGPVGPPAPGPGGPPASPYEERPGLLRSRLCSQEQMETEQYARWCAEFLQKPSLHRKQWEWVFILQALEERGLLAPGRRGIGFGVGSEPLTALFARRGVEVVATDLDADAAVQAGWLNADQHAAGLAALDRLGLCPADRFARLVSFRVEDMNAISPDLHGGFDFTWSSCCFEHLGSIEHGLRFVEESLRLLKPGGVAVHTTEFNLSSNTDTLSEGGCVLFRRRDIDRLARRLTAAGHRICLDYSEGDGPADRHVDVPPYDLSLHLRLLLDGFVSTSIGLIVQRPPL